MIDADGDHLHEIGKRRWAVYLGAVLDQKLGAEFMESLLKEKERQFSELMDIDDLIETYHEVAEKYRIPLPVFAFDIFCLPSPKK